MTLSPDPQQRRAEAFFKRADANARAMPDALRQEGEGLAASSSGDALALIEIGLAKIERIAGNLDRAIALLESAAERAKDSALRAEAELRLVPMLGAAGRAEQAFSLAEMARRHAPAEKVPRLLSQVGTIHSLRGEHAEAIALFDEALSIAEVIGDDEAVAVLLNNRASAKSDAGQLAEAEIDIRRAMTMNDAFGVHSPALARHNLGLILGRQGQLRSALLLFDEAAREEVGFGLHNGEVERDQVEVLFNARALQEAERLAESVLDRSLEAGSITITAKFRRLLARIHIAQEADDAAEADFVAMREHFVTNGPPESAAWAERMAQLFDLDARPLFEDYDTSDPLVAEGLTRRGERLMAAGRADQAEPAFRRVADGVARINPAERVVQLFAQARCDAIGGDLDAASDALDRCFDLLEYYAGGLESIELRSRALRSIVPIESMAVEFAQRTGVPGDFIHWIDRTRRVVLGGPMMATPSPELIEQLEELRGTLSDVCAASDPERNRQRQAIEARIRFLSWTAERAEGAHANSRPLSDLAHPGMLIYGERNGRLIGMCAGPHASLVDLGPVEAVHQALHMLRFLSSLAARTYPAPEPRDFQALERQSSKIDAMLVAPLIGEQSFERISIVPTSAVQAVPWGFLPSLRARPTRVVSGRYPTTEVDRDELPRNHLVAVAGPGLSEDNEVAAIGSLYDSTDALGPQTATCHNVLSALDTADVLHVAAHGSIRADDPLLSNLDLSDGPLTAYDIETAHHVPETVVLACCRVGGTPSNHTAAYGLATVLAAKGARQIVASSVDLSDEHARVVMPALHRLLRDGHDAEDAIAALDFDEPQTQLAARSLVAIRSI